MKIVRIEIPFENHLTRLQTILGWIYLPLHLVALPLLLGMYAEHAGMASDTVNLIYLGVSLAFCLIVMMTFLRKSFDVLCDRLPICVACIFIAMLVDYAFSIAGGLVLLLLESSVENPNNEAIMTMAESATGVIAGLTIFIAPIVEELLFRGVAFGSLRGRSRGWAYVISTLLFSLSHVWQYVLVSGDFTLLLYAIQYIPISVALAWSYERSGSIWTPLFFHMGYNAVSFIALSLL